MMKQAYMRLARVLLSNGDKEAAVAVLDKCIEFFPNDKDPYDILMLSYPEIYYAAGATEKGDEFMKTLLENSTDNLRYYYDLDPQFILYYTDGIYENMAIMDKMIDIATRFKRNELRTQITKALNEENSKFYPYLVR